MQNRLFSLGKVTRLLTLLVLSIAVLIGTSVTQAPTARADGVYCGYTVKGSIERKYLLKGGLQGPLQCPTSNELGNPGPYGSITGYRSEFGPRGMIYFKGGNYGMVVWGLIRNSWAAAGYERSPYRYPIRDEYQFATSPWPQWQQDFECGYFRAGNALVYRFFTCT